MVGRSVSLALIALSSACGSGADVSLAGRDFPTCVERVAPYVRANAGVLTEVAEGLRKAEDVGPLFRRGEKWAALQTSSTAVGDLDFDHPLTDIAANLEGGRFEPTTFDNREGEIIANIDAWCGPGDRSRTHPAGATEAPDSVVYLLSGSANAQEPGIVLPENGPPDTDGCGPNAFENPIAMCRHQITEDWTFAVDWFSADMAAIDRARENAERYPLGPGGGSAPSDPAG